MQTFLYFAAYLYYVACQNTCEWCNFKIREVVWQEQAQWIPR